MLPNSSRNKCLRRDHVEVSVLVSNNKTITDSFEKAEVLNDQFYVIFTDKDSENIPKVAMYINQ